MKLFPHQKQALQATSGQNRVAYYLDMGLGKTFVGSEKMHELDADVNLVICQKSKIDDWFEHFETYYSNQGYIFNNLTNKKEFEYFIDVTSQGQAKIVGFINYELAWRRKELLKLENFTLMLDESSLIQNRKAKQSKFILKLKPQNVILLSGTPCSGKYENLWSQIHLLGWEIKESLYNKQYVNWKTIEVGEFKHKIVDKEKPYKNVDRLKAKLRRYGAVFMKTDECFDLPQQNVIDIYCKAPREYKRFVKDSIVTIGDKELVGDTTLTKRLYERMIASQYNDNKFQSFYDLVESTNDRLIVFYNFNEELEPMVNMMYDESFKRPFSIVNGKTKDLRAYEEWDNSVTFVQYQAGAKGLNLQKANKIIYFSPTEKCEDYMQSLKRIHRIGQEKPCFYYRLITKNTIEKDIYKAVESGVDYTDELFKEKRK
ncbi:SNF2-related protein [Amedibacterium intestinale]|uniref:SNF2-related protein n=1 Tax=Amedibacterium intestinale TaxID=2583452 RepID=UPI0015ACF641|nr:DEAD/DEAH box helicase [Amedibacterium intestinale]